MSDVVALLVAVLLLAGNAFFVGAEFALISARREQIEPQAAAGSARARTTLKAIEQVSLMMAGAQLGITMCSLGLGAVGEPAVAHLLEGPLEAAGLPEALLHPLAFAVALAVVVFLHMVLGEMVPKNIAIAGPVRTALLLGPVLYAFVRLLRPLIVGLNHVSDGVLRLIRVQPTAEVGSAFTSEQVHDLVAESHREGLLDEQERELLTGTLTFEQRTAAEVAIPLGSLVTIAGTETVAELEQLCARTGFSRLPVREGEELRGYVHVKDLVGLSSEDRERPVDAEHVRRLTTVRTVDLLSRVLRGMRDDEAHLGLVVGEDGRPVGLVALEDVLEELVGEVRDATQDVDAQPATAAARRGS